MTARIDEDERIRRFKHKPLDNHSPILKQLCRIQWQDCGNYMSAGLAVLSRSDNQDRENFKSIDTYHKFLRQMMEKGIINSDFDAGAYEIAKGELKNLSGEEEPSNVQNNGQNTTRKDDTFYYELRVSKEQLAEMREIAKSVGKRR